MKHLLSIFLISILFTNCEVAQEINTIKTVELKALIEKEKIQLVDVRTPDEIANGFIKTAMFANYYDANFTQKIIKILDKNKPVYLYCRSGNRSEKSAKILQEQGFEVYNVIGGYKMWKTEN
ncbi:rhodanese-like domain-containing protein [uncultured Polaribacter sp.]|uniref:rhodanese-like domain-containing protein n=1 Tax=uncultured Polaribacter sp. TaxID=174711 RepID=UPI00261C072B|nr:rhodanese-like domain-containing protein [uncultured Polaribacter sp.]